MPFDPSREELAAPHAADERTSVSTLHRGAGSFRYLVRGL